MQADIDAMIPPCRIGIEEPVEEQRGVQDGTHHVIEMTEKGLPLSKMRILQNGGHVIKLKSTQEGIGVNQQGGSY